MSRLTAARPQIATRLHSRSGNMHTVLLAEPQRVVRAGRSLLAEYKGKTAFQVVLAMGWVRVQLHCVD